MHSKGQWVRVFLKKRTREKLEEEAYYIVETTIDHQKVTHILRFNGLHSRFT